jgi:hypothetical protein
MRVCSDCYENFLGVRILGGTPRARSVQKELRTWLSASARGIVDRTQRTENSSAYAFWVETEFGSFTACQISKECVEIFCCMHFGRGSFGLFSHPAFPSGVTTYGVGDTGRLTGSAIGNKTAPVFVPRPNVDLAIPAI